MTIYASQLVRSKSGLHLCKDYGVLQYFFYQEFSPKNQMMLQEWLYQPWPWYVVGPLMGATIPLLLFSGNKMLGVSSSLRHLCALIPNRLSYFQYDLKTGYWNLFFVLGVFLGAGLAYHFLYEVDEVAIASATVQDLANLGLMNRKGILPAEIFGPGEVWSLQGLTFTLGGGFLMGFGVRYAGGCTSGHGFMGLSQLSPSSSIAICAFFIGGLLATFLLLPLLLT